MPSVSLIFSRALRLVRPVRPARRTAADHPPPGSLNVTVFDFLDDLVDRAGVSFRPDPAADRPPETWR